MRSRSQTASRRQPVVHAVGGPAAKLPLWDVLRGSGPSPFVSLGFDAEVPPPLYQASAPGKPDLDRPAIPIDRDTSALLVAAVKRSFPMPPVDESVEIKKAQPFRTAFSSIAQALPPPVRSKRGSKRNGNNNTQQQSGATTEGSKTHGPEKSSLSLVSTASKVEYTQGGLEVTVLQPGDVLDYVAFGPYPRVLPETMTRRAATPSALSSSQRASSSKPRRIGTTFEEELRLRSLEIVAQRNSPTHRSFGSFATAQSSPRRQLPLSSMPSYVRLAEEWRRQEEIVFTVDPSNKTRIKQEQQQRVARRNARRDLEELEQESRRALVKEIREAMAALRNEARKRFEAQIESDERDAKNKEHQRQEMLRHMRLMQAAEQLAARQRAVRERAEWMVDLDRDKVIREEQGTRNKLRQLEAEACARAKRREQGRLTKEALQLRHETPIGLVSGASHNQAPSASRPSTPPLNASTPHKESSTATTPRTSVSILASPINHAVMSSPTTTTTDANATSPPGLLGTRNAELSTSVQRHTSAELSLPGPYDATGVGGNATPSQQQQQQEGGSRQQLSTSILVPELSPIPRVAPLEHLMSLNITFSQPAYIAAGVLCTNDETRCEATAPQWREVRVVVHSTATSAESADSVALFTTPVQLHLRVAVKNGALEGEADLCDRLHTVAVPGILSTRSSTDESVTFELANPARRWSNHVLLDFVSKSLESLHLYIAHGTTIEAREVSLLLSARGVDAVQAPLGECLITVPVIAPLIRLVGATPTVTLSRAAPTPDFGADDAPFLGVAAEVPRSTPVLPVATEMRVLRTDTNVNLNTCSVVVESPTTPLECLVLDAAVLGESLTWLRSEVGDALTLYAPSFGADTAVQDAAIALARITDSSTPLCPRLTVTMEITGRVRLRSKGRLTFVNAATIIELVLGALRCTANSIMLLPSGSTTERHFTVTVRAATRESQATQAVKTVVADASVVNLPCVDSSPAVVRAGLHRTAPFAGVIPIAPRYIFVTGTTITASLTSLSRTITAIPGNWSVASTSPHLVPSSVDGFLRWAHSGAKIRVASWRLVSQSIVVTLVEDCPAALVHQLLTLLEFAVGDVAPGQAACPSVPMNVAIVIAPPASVALVPPTMPSSVIALFSASAAAPHRKRRAAGAGTTVATSAAPTLHPWASSLLEIPATERATVTTTVELRRPFVVEPGYMTAPIAPVTRLPFSVQTGSRCRIGQRVQVRTDLIAASTHDTATITVSAAAIASFRLDEEVLKSQSLELDEDTSSLILPVDDMSSVEPTIKKGKGFMTISHLPLRYLATYIAAIQSEAVDAGVTVARLLVVAHNHHHGTMTTSYRDEIAFDLLHYKLQPFPAVEIPARTVEYRLGSRLALIGFPIFPSARAVLPAGFRALTCELSVELTAGGFGDGQDVIEWLRPEQAEAVAKERLMSEAGSQDASIDGPLPVVVAEKHGSLKIGDRVVGSWQDLPSGGLAATFHLGEEVLISDAAVASAANDITAALRCIAYRNGDPRLKAGARVYSVRLSFGRDEPFRSRVTVNAIPYVFAVPAFASRIHCISGQQLASVCPKLVVNALEFAIPAASVLIQPVAGWVAEDCLTFTASNSDLVEIVSESVTELAVYSPPGSEVPVATGRISGGRCIALDFTSKSIQGKVLQQLMRCVGYSNSGANLIAGPRTVEYLFDDPDGTSCWGSVQVVVRVPELPAIIDLLGGTRAAKQTTPPVTSLQIPFVLDGKPIYAAPNLTLTMRSALPADGTAAAVPQSDSRPTLRVEFIHQTVPADMLSLEAAPPPSSSDANQDGLTFDGNRLSIFGVEVGVVTVRRRDTFVVAFHPSTFSDVVAQTVMRHTAYKFLTADGATAPSTMARRLKTRGNAKKIQMSFSPTGHGLWCRVVVIISLDDASTTPISAAAVPQGGGGESLSDANLNR